MIISLKHLEAIQNSMNCILDDAFSNHQYCRLDLSSSNLELQDIDITNPLSCQKYIDLVLKRNDAKVAFGGYLEKRNLYSDKTNFSNSGLQRNIHLGVDFWTKAGTKVIVPLKGKVHSFKNNSTKGDYGPTIIIQHELEGLIFHTLYGHLSIASISNISLGQEFESGAFLGRLGTSDINVNYAPHLHFQVIYNMEHMKGDYPGVCTVDTLDFYSKNCPNPNFLLKFKS